MTSAPNLNELTPEQLRALAAQLLSQADTMGKKIHRDQAVIEQLTHEIALLKRYRFAKRSEQLSPDQISLLDELIDTDIAAIAAELKALHPAPVAQSRQQPKRAALPAQFPRTLIHHEPDNTQCACGCQLKRIGEDVGVARSVGHRSIKATESNMSLPSIAEGGSTHVRSAIQARSRDRASHHITALSRATSLFGASARPWGRA